MGVFPKTLTVEEETALLKQLSEGDEEAKRRLVEHNLRLVIHIAKRFANTDIDIDDLVSIGTIGLIKAIDRFDPTKQARLATFASTCIENEILMYLRRTVKLKSEVSFDEPLNTDFEGNELLLSDILGTDSETVYGGVEANVEKELLKEALKRLPERERRIMYMRFGLGGKQEMTQKDVAKMVGISQVQVCRIEKQVLSLLGQELKEA